MKVKSVGLLLVVTSTLMSCYTGKYAATEKVYVKKAKEFAKIYKKNPAEQQLGQVEAANKEWVASVNFGMRKPNYVMIHHTAQHSVEQTIRTFHNAVAEVSSHYVIGRDGKVVQMVNDYYRAHHAGAGKW